MSAKRYIAMCQIYEYEKDEDGKIKYFPTSNPYHNNNSQAPEFIQRPRSVKMEGKFRPFGTNGKVASMYDLAAKARRYCGKEGHVVELDFDDCKRIELTVEEEWAHCEARMLFWGQEADRLQALMKKVND